MKRLNIRTVGTIIMAVGFVYALATMMLAPDNRQGVMIGIALIGLGSLMGIRRRRPTRRPPQTPDPAGNKTETKKKKK